MFATIQVSCILFIAAASALSWVGWYQMVAFNKAFPSIKTQNDLLEFRRVAKANMYIALAMIGCIFLGVAITGVGIALGAIKLKTMLAGSFVVAAVFLVGGLIQTATEKRVKATPVEDAKLKPEFDEIVEVWTKKALPNW